MKTLGMEEATMKRLLGRKLLALRVQHGLTQTEAAARLGCSQRALSYWEEGARLPHSREMWGLCQLYDVTFESLVGDLFDTIPHKVSA